MQEHAVELVLIGLCEDVLEAVISRPHPWVRSSLMTFSSPAS
jgi:hypothetical protein